MAKCGCSDPAIACDLSAIPEGSRAAHMERSKRLFAKHAEAINWRESGYELQIAKNAEDLVDLAQWAHDESLCCPFLTFQLQVEPGGKCISMRVTEPEGARGFLRTELKALKVL